MNENSNAGATRVESIRISETIAQQAATAIPLTQHVHSSQRGAAKGEGLLEDISFALLDRQPDLGSEFVETRIRRSETFNQIPLVFLLLSEDLRNGFNYCYFEL